MPSDYTELLIRLGHYDRKAQTYAAEAILGDGSVYYGGRLKIIQADLTAKSLDSEAYGQYLFATLFVGPIRRAYDKAISLAQSQTAGRLRVRLWVDTSAAELHALQWERLYHTYNGQSIPLAATAQTPFSRYLGLEMPESPPISGQPLKMLLVFANPLNLPQAFSPVDVAEGVESLYHAFDRLNQAGLVVRLTVMAGRTPLPDSLTRKMRQAGWYLVDGATSCANLLEHVSGQQAVHFVGHGSLNRRRRGEGQIALLLENESDGGLELVTDEVLTTHLASLATQPHLFFLNACPMELGNSKHEHPFVGLAPKLIKTGVTAVVATQAVISVSTVRLLAYDFYHHLQQHGNVDTALNQARQLLWNRGDTAWDVPVLFMRSATGQLLEPDVVRVTLENIVKHESFAFFTGYNNEYLPIPIEVLHLTGQQQFDELAYSRVETTAKVALQTAILAVFDKHQQADRQVAQLVVLVGNHGTSKSTQMRHFVWSTADSYLKDDEVPENILPLYVDLTHYPAMRAEFGNPLETLIFRTLAEFWPKLTKGKLRQLLLSKKGPSLRLLFDSSDELSERERRGAWQQLVALIQAYPRHQYLISCNFETFKPRYFAGLSLQILVMQALAPRKVRQFLENRTDSVSLTLLRHLENRQLFDLGAIPWFIIRMLERAEYGDFPSSRTEVLRNIVEDALAQIPTHQGMRHHAEAFIYDLAWQMYPQRATSWPITDVFNMLAAQRGNRGYNLEALYQALIDSVLLAGVDNNRVCFTYSAVQEYCAAKAIMQQPNRDQLLDDITARFGRLSWLRWGGRTMVYLSGLLASQPDSLNHLMQMIVYGVDLLTSPQTFLAAHCMLEAHNERQRLGLETTSYDAELRDQIINALVWRLDSQHESRLAYRLYATELLGQIDDPIAIRQLIRTATASDVRLDLQQRWDYDFASIRMTAVLDLHRIVSYGNCNVKIEPFLQHIFDLWKAKDVEQLLTYLDDTASVKKSMAIFALADLQTQLVMLTNWQAEAETIQTRLIDTFFDFETDEATLWVTSQALALLDTTAITKRVIHHLLTDESFIKDRHQPEVILREKCLAYLIGRIRSREPIAHDYLTKRCLRHSADFRLWGTAIESLGLLAYAEDKPLLEAVAIGDTESIYPDYKFFPQHQLYVQAKAITALGEIGDAETLSRLRYHRINWQPKLRHAFYRTSENIYWRMNYLEVVNRLGDQGSEYVFG